MIATSARRATKVGSAGASLSPARADAHHDGALGADGEHRDVNNYRRFNYWHISLHVLPCRA